MLIMYDVLLIYRQCRYVVFIAYGMFYLRTIYVCDMLSYLHKIYVLSY